MEKIQCEVCDTEIDDSDWESHIDTNEHKEKTLTQIMEDRIGKEISPNVRDETTEILEELELEHKDDSDNSKLD